MNFSMQELGFLLSVGTTIISCLLAYIGLQLRIIKADMAIIKAQVVGVKDCDEHRAAYNTKLGNVSDRVSKLEGQMHTRR